ASCRMGEMLPSVHVPSKQSRDRKTLVGMRDTLVQSRTRHINAVRGWLRGQLRRPRTGPAETFPERVRELLTEHQVELPPYVEVQLRVLEELNRSIDDADRELAKEAKADPRCQLLMTIPGVGPTVSLAFVAAVDDPGRFPH